MQEQVRDGFMEQTSQLQRFSVWLQLKDNAHSPTFQMLFKYASCMLLLLPQFVILILAIAVPTLGSFLFMLRIFTCVWCFQLHND